MIFGRAATPEELAAGREFLATEPMRQYEEQKAEGEGGERKKDKPADAAPAKPADNADGPPPPPPGMMAGVMPAAGSTKDEKERLPVTVFGR